MLTAAMLLPNAGPNPAPTSQQLERFESMRVAVVSLTVVAPTQGNVNEPTRRRRRTASSSRSSPARRGPSASPASSCLTPPPSEAPATVPLFDENPERIRVDSDAQIGAAAIDVATGQTITGMIGVLGYDFRTYTIFPDPAAPISISGSATATPGPRAGRDDVYGRARTTWSASSTRSTIRTSSDVGADDDGVQQPAEQGVARRPARAAHAGHPRRAGNGEPHDAARRSRRRSTTTRWRPAIRTRSTWPYLVEGNDIGGIDVGFLVKSTVVSVVGRDAGRQGCDVHQPGHQSAGSAERSAAARAAGHRAEARNERQADHGHQQPPPLAERRGYERRGRPARARQAQGAGRVPREPRPGASARRSRTSGSFSSATSTPSTSTTATWTASRRSRARPRQPASSRWRARIWSRPTSCSCRIRAAGRAVLVRVRRQRTDDRSRAGHREPGRRHHQRRARADERGLPRDPAQRREPAGAPVGSRSGAGLHLACRRFRRRRWTRAPTRRSSSTNSASGRSRSARARRERAR